MVTKEELIEEVFKKYVDPELGIDIWALGLIYNLELDERQEKIKILLTFTSPFCPYGPQMVDELKEMALSKGAKEVEIEVTFDPPWQPSEELKEMMGMG